jgi:Bacterial type II/III secretion system short domain
MRTKPLILLVLGLLAVAAVATMAATDVIVLKPKHRTGADLLPALRAAAGSGGNVNLDERTGFLVVTGDAAALARVQKVLATLDIKPRTVEIQWQTIGRNQHKNLGISIDWTVSGPGWRIGTLPAENGVRGRATHRVHRSSDAARQTVRVLEGSAGTIVTARQEHFALPGRHGGGGVRHATVALMIKPRLVGNDQIELSIFPQLTTTNRNGRRTQQATDIATTVRVRSGEQFLLGAAEQNGDATMISGLFSDLQQTHEASGRLYLVRATIEK